MGMYGERMLPRIVNMACGQQDMRPLRRRACACLAGDVVEIGFGSGHNVPFYPPAVTRVAAIEPAGLGWKLADKRLRAATVPVRLSGLDGQDLTLSGRHFRCGPVHLDALHHPRCRRRAR